MRMETHDDALMASPNNNSSSVSTNDHSPGIAKGKRTKRQRLHQLLAPAASSSSTSSSGELSGSTTEEEEDMANCLILLARGRALGAEPKSQMEEEALGGDGGFGGGERFTSRRLAEAATTTQRKVGYYVYECKTCNKCFPSFQALGGHRASHKKPKTAPAAATEEKKGTQEDVLQIRSFASYPNLNILPNNSPGGSTAAAPPAVATSGGAAGSNKPRVHECSICGSEFSSGQALGGHMRRHRPAVVVSEPQEAKKEKNFLSLDLNLPAPLEDDRGDITKSPSFPFSGKQPLIFSASPLVDCHY